MFRSLLASTLAGFVLSAAASPAAAEGSFLNLGARCGEVLKVEEVEGATRVHVRVHYFEPFSSRTQVGEDWLFRYYLVRRGVQRKHTDGWFILKDDARVRVVAAPVWDAKQNRFVPARVEKDPSDPDRNRLPGRKGAADDIEKGDWIAFALQKNRDGANVSPLIIVGKGEAKPK